MSKVDSKSSSANKSANTSRSGRSMGAGNTATSSKSSAAKAVKAAQSGTKVKEIKDDFKKSSELKSLERGEVAEKAGVNFDAWGLDNSPKSAPQHDIHHADPGHKFGDILPAKKQNFQFGDIVVPPGAGL